MRGILQKLVEIARDDCTWHRSIFWSSQSGSGGYSLLQRLRSIRLPVHLRLHALGLR